MNFTTISLGDFTIETYNVCCVQIMVAIAKTGETYMNAFDPTRYICAYNIFKIDIINTKCIRCQSYDTYSKDQSEFSLHYVTGNDFAPFRKYTASVPRVFVPIVLQAPQQVEQQTIWQTPQQVEQQVEQQTIWQTPQQVEQQTIWQTPQQAVLQTVQQTPQQAVLQTVQQAPQQAVLQAPQQAEQQSHVNVATVVAQSDTVSTNDTSINSVLQISNTTSTQITDTRVTNNSQIAHALRSHSRKAQIPKRASVMQHPLLEPILAKQITESPHSIYKSLITASTDGSIGLIKFYKDILQRDRRLMSVCIETSDKCGHIEIYNYLMKGCI